ncbi:MAG TPA: hypothetical protein DCQ58_05155 [Saprospirales bacterium]|nr:hypothetical protein [Saprospirales bacterium]
MEKHFLIELDYFDPEIQEAFLYDEKLDQIIAELKTTNRVVSISISEEQAVMWIVMKASSESDLEFVLDSLKLPEVSSYDFYLLDYHVSINTYESYSLN